MKQKNILVVDDEENILELVKYNLMREGYEVTCAGTGEEGLAIAESKQPDLAILDLMLPGLDGLEVCKCLKGSNRTRRIPIIMLTAKGEESDIVTGLKLGADDYITKPFSPKELVARIRAVLRRKESKETEGKIVKVYNISIDPDRYEVKAQGKKVDLTFTEFGILNTMAKQPGRVFTRQQLVEAIHDDYYVVSDRAVDVQIASLRRKLGHCGKYVETVRGVGCRLKD